MAAKDETGKQYGKLTVIKRDTDKMGGAAYWICRCECGKIISTRGTSLRDGSKKDCGCVELQKRREKIDLTSLVGQKFGRLTVIERDLSKPTGHGHDGYWICECECGNKISARTHSLKSENVRSCGCLKTSDITGKRFGSLVAIQQTKKVGKKGNRYWICRCDCGNEFEVSIGQLTAGVRTQCEACRKGISFDNYLEDNGNFTVKNADLTGMRFGHLTVIEKLDRKTTNGYYYWRCKCDCGNDNYEIDAVRLVAGEVNSCRCNNSKSRGEYQIQQILIDNHILFKCEYSFSDLRNILPYRYDFAIFNENGQLQRLIEFDGEQHFKSGSGWNTKENFERTQKSDKEKNEYALSHNIPLVRIPYTKLNSISLEDLLGDEFLLK